MNTEPDLFAVEEAAILRGQAVQSQARAHKRKHRIHARRAKSEATLRDIWQMPEPGESLHVISQGDIDAMSYPALMLEDGGPVDLLLFSTWCMAMPDVETLADWVKAGKVRRVEAYVGEIFPNQYPDEHWALCDLARETGGRVAVFRNHSKLFVGFSGTDAWVAEGSANINTNPRCEQTTVHRCPDLARHYRDFFDSIRSFNRDFDDWKPYEH